MNGENWCSYVSCHLTKTLRVSTLGPFYRCRNLKPRCSSRAQVGRVCVSGTLHSSLSGPSCAHLVSSPWGSSSGHKSHGHPSVSLLWVPDWWPLYPGDQFSRGLAPCVGQKGSLLWGQVGFTITRLSRVVAALLTAGFLGAEWKPPLKQSRANERI